MKYTNTQKILRHFFSGLIKLCRSEINHIDSMQRKAKSRKGWKECGGETSLKRLEKMKPGRGI